MSETREQRLAGIRERAEELFDRQNPEDDMDDMFHGHEMIDFALSFADSEIERVLLEAAKAICDGCGKDAIVLQVDGGFFHLANGQYVCCEAAAIHDLRSKGESRGEG